MNPYAWKPCSFLMPVFLISLGAWRLGIPALGDWLSCHLSVPTCDMETAPAWNPTIKGRYLGLSLAPLSDHAWCWFDQNQRRQMLEGSDMHELSLRDSASAKPSELLSPSFTTIYSFHGSSWQPHHRVDCSLVFIFDQTFQTYLRGGANYVSGYFDHKWKFKLPELAHNLAIYTLF